MGGRFNLLRSSRTSSRSVSRKKCPSVGKRIRHVFGVVNLSVGGGGISAKPEEAADRSEKVQWF